MAVDFQYLDNRGYSGYEEAIFNILKSTLQYPATVEAQSAMLTDEIVFFLESREQSIDLGEILMVLWGVIIDIALCLPPSHQCQSSLVRALAKLRMREGIILGGAQADLWKDLPDLSMFMRERWDVPLSTGAAFEQANAGFDIRRNLNSFTARLTATGFDSWVKFPIWELRDAFEESMAPGIALETQLWIATEWLIHCSDVLYECMSSEEQLDQNSARALQSGSLCSSVSPLSLERWRHWKDRAVELAAASDIISGSIAVRLSEAVDCMTAAEGKNN